MRTVGAETCEIDLTLMPLEGDEGRSLSTQIPDPSRFVVGRCDYVRSVSAE
jgi:hypothetical protein